MNSIRRSANGRSVANDVSLLWRHSSWSRSWRLERAYRRPFWRFWGNLNPKMLLSSCGPQKGTSLRHNACFEPSCVKLHARVTSVGKSGKKLKIKIKKRGLIFHVFRQALLYGRLAQILGYVLVSWT